MATKTAKVKKTSCPVTRQEFRQTAQALAVRIGETLCIADPKEFSTDSLGWYLNQKVTVELNGKRVTCQVGLNVTIVGSKELPR